MMRCRVENCVNESFIDGRCREHWLLNDLPTVAPLYHLPGEKDDPMRPSALPKDLRSTFDPMRPSYLDLSSWKK